MVKHIVLIDRSTIEGRVYASSLFVRLCEQTSMEVSVGGNGVSYSGSTNDIIVAEKVIADFKKEYGEAP